MEWEGYAAVHVYHDEVAAVLRKVPSGAKSIEVFAKSVGIGQPSKLMRMIKEGLVQTTTLKNPVTKASQEYFTPDDETSFRVRYVTPKLMTKIYSTTWQSSVRRLRDVGIEPLGGRDGPFGHVYLREETDRILT